MSVIIIFIPRKKSILRFVSYFDTFFDRHHQEHHDREDDNMRSAKIFFFLYTNPY